MLCLVRIVWSAHTCQLGSSLLEKESTLMRETEIPTCQVYPKPTKNSPFHGLRVTPKWVFIVGSHWAHIVWLVARWPKLCVDPPFTPRGNDRVERASVRDLYLPRWPMSDDDE